MKLLLTSGGITNKTIADALFDLVGKKPEDTTIIFVPTASNTLMEDKEWVIDDLILLKNLNFKSIQIIDISALDQEIWRTSFEKADVFYFEGGDPFHLMKWILLSGLKKIMPILLESKVLVGNSAGSEVMTKELSFKIAQDLYDEGLGKEKNMNGLDLVNFVFLPHLNNEYFSNVTKENIEKTIEGITEKVYALDDQGALKVIDGEVTVVTEGLYLEYN